MTEFTSPSEYQKLADRTKCDQQKVLDRINEIGPYAIQLLHAVLGLAGEVGELAAQVEGWLWYGKSLDLTNVKEELGDCEWYIAEAANCTTIDMLEIMRANIRKLKKRFPDKFDHEKVLEENRDRTAEAKEVDGR